MADGYTTSVQLRRPEELEQLERKLAEDVQAFLSNGGVIQHIAPGVGAWSAPADQIAAIGADEGKTRRGSANPGWTKHLFPQADLDYAARGAKDAHA